MTQPSLPRAAHQRPTLRARRKFPRPAMTDGGAPAPGLVPRSSETLVFMNPRLFMNPRRAACAARSAFIDLALERHQFAFEPAHAPGQVGGCRRHDRGRLAFLAEGHADVVTRPPLHPRPESLVLVGDIELDDFG